MGGSARSLVERGQFGGVWAQNATRKAAGIAGARVLEAAKPSIAGSLRDALPAFPDAGVTTASVADAGMTEAAEGFTAASLGALPADRAISRITATHPRPAAEYGAVDQPGRRVLRC